MADQSAFPLSWPVTRPRTPRHQVGDSAFGKHTVAQARDELIGELDRLGASGRVISSHIPLRRDGTMRGDSFNPADAGVAVYFTLKGKPMVMACDRWRKIEHNLWAIARTVEAQRGVTRWGAVSVEQAFAGYAALPAPGSDPARNCWTALGLAPGSSTGEIQLAYRTLSQVRHPDKPGGSHEKMAELNKARDEAIAAASHQASGGTR